MYYFPKEKKLPKILRSQRSLEPSTFRSFAQKSRTQAAPAPYPMPYGMNVAPAPQVGRGKTQGCFGDSPMDEDSMSESVVKSLPSGETPGLECV